MTANMTNPNEIADAIESGGISNYDGFLEIRFNGKPIITKKLDVDSNYIRFSQAEYKLTEWLRGLRGSRLWSVEWFNK